jgi:fumarylpyruvate hydrolase
MSTNLLFHIPLPPPLPVLGNDKRFPVNRIFCVGRNYADHAKEMGVEVDREAPFYFTKPASAIVRSGAVIPYPPGTSNYHYEMELVIAIGSPAFRVSPTAAEATIFGYAAGLDMTRRDLQLDARDKGRPWDIGKNVEQSSPLGLIRKAGDGFDPDKGAIQLTLNGVKKQEADLADMVWPVADIIAYVSGFYRILPGDLIYTGTPAGVGPVVTGDAITVSVEGLKSLNVRIGPPAA